MTHIDKILLITELDEKINYLERLDYEFIFKFKSGEVKGECPALGIEIVASNYEDALAMLKTEKAKIFHEVITTNTWEELVFPENYKNITKNHNFKELVKYYPVFRDILVLFAIMIGLFVAIGKVKGEKERFKAKLKTIIEPTSEQREERLKKYKLLLKELKPFVEETKKQYLD